MKEFLSNLFWKIVLPFFRCKWWWSNRKEHKKFREREQWEYILHGYKTCIYYHRSSETSEEYCERKVKNKFLLFFRYRAYRCDKSKHCKHYMYDPVKSG